MKEIKLKKNKGCMECVSHSCDTFGYPRITIKGKLLRFHQYVWIVFKGNLPKNKVIRHLCHNPKCGNIFHLVEGTTKDNINDTVIAKRHTWGEKHPNAKLNWVVVKNIRALLLDGFSGREIARRYKISEATVSNIKHKKNWVQPNQKNENNK